MDNISMYPISIDHEVISTGDKNLWSEWQTVADKFPRFKGERIYDWCMRMLLLGGLSDRLWNIVQRYKYDCWNHIPGCTYTLPTKS